jgi:hypothetical protein
VLQRRGIGLQGGRLKEGKPPFPAVIISYVPSYVNAVTGSWVREERSVRSGRARPQRAVHRLQAPLAPSGPQPTDGAFLCAVYPSGKKNASVWRSPSRDAGLKNGPESKLSRVRAVLLLPSGSSRGSSRLDCGNPRAVSDEPLQRRIRAKVKRVLGRAVAVAAQAPELMPSQAESVDDSLFVALEQLRYDAVTQHDFRRRLSR